MMTADQLITAYSTGSTTRYHTNAKLLQQGVDAHTWGVAALLAMVHPAPSAALLCAALFHDMGERFGPGDINFFAKIKHPELGLSSQRAEDEALSSLGLPEQPISVTEARWLKWADGAEVAMHAHRLWTDLGAPAALKVLRSALRVMEQYDDLGPIVLSLRLRLEEDA